MKRTLVIAVAVGAVVAALTLALSACGGDGDSDNGVASLTSTNGQTGTGGSAGSGGAATPQKRRQAELEFARCMREHGVDMPDPVNGQFRLRVGKGDQRKAEEAQRACRPILRNVAPRMSEEQQAKMRDAALAFARCMREHGVDMPDPQFPAGGGMTMRMPEGSSPDDPKVQEAQKACAPILQNARPDKTGGGGSENS